MDIKKKKEPEKTFRYKNWIFIMDKSIMEAVENEEDIIDLNLTIKQAIFFRQCIQECRLKKIKNGEIVEEFKATPK